MIRLFCASGLQKRSVSLPACSQLQGLKLAGRSGKLFLPQKAMGHADLWETFQTTRQVRDMWEGRRKPGEQQRSCQDKGFPQSSKELDGSYSSQEATKMKKIDPARQIEQDFFSCTSIIIYSYSEVTMLEFTAPLLLLNITQSVCKKASQCSHSLGSTTLRLYPNIALFLSGRLVSTHQVPLPLQYPLPSLLNFKSLNPLVCHV